MQILNRKAQFNYFVEEEIEAGLVLLGSEVKSIRLGRASIGEGYVTENNGELFLINCDISPYKGANQFNHAPKRQRKVLLHKKQIQKILGKLTVKGYSLIPLKIFFNKRNVAKVLIGICKGKKLYDKRETIKKRDLQRQAQRGEE